ncbi:MAG TPA: Ig-like domain-containing protein [Petrotogaceae bacterium]|nr:Ig-like domain-containing protein [Petrotogaceae bacterium]
MKFRKYSLAFVLFFLLSFLLIGCSVQTNENKTVTKPEPIKINKAPLISIPDQFIKEEDSLTLDLSKYSSDPEASPLTYSLVSGVGTIKSEAYFYSPKRGEFGEKSIIISVSDGASSTQASFKISVEKVLKLPTVEFPDFSVEEGKSIEIDLSKYSSNPLKDKLSYSIISGVGILNDFNYFFQPSYLDAGQKAVKIRIANYDGYIDQTFRLNIINVNRPPTIFITNQTMDELQTLTLDLARIATDPDGDSLTFRLEEGPGSISNKVYSYSPTYKDQGEKNVRISVSDGIARAETSFKVLVNNINRPPYMLVQEQEVDEGQTLLLDLGKIVFDPDGDTLSFEIEEGVGEISGSMYTFLPTYFDAGKKMVKLRVSDGTSTIYTTFSINVKNMNRVPVIKVPDQSVDEGKTLLIDLSAHTYDPDNDKITYTLESSIGKLKGSIYEYSPDFFDAGEKTVKIRANDGNSNIETLIKIVVNNVNRAPSIKVSDQQVNEGQTLIFDLSRYSDDPDTDTLTYYVQEGVGSINGSQFIYTPGYFDAGTKKVTVRASDGSLSAVSSFNINVKNVNRAPSMAVPDETVDEAQTLTLDLSKLSSDPDKDGLSYYSVNNVGSISGSIFTYTTTYDDAGEKLARVGVSDGELSYETYFKIIVKNVNRAPQISIPDQTAFENNKLTLDLSKYSSDPDNDKLSYSVLNQTGKIEGNSFIYTPSYFDAGEKVVQIAAFDGKLYGYSTFKITVNNVNRAPSIFIPDQEIDEGKTLNINLFELSSDLDGDTLKYFIGNGIGSINGNNYTYSPAFSDAGIKIVEVIAFDGIDRTAAKFKINVKKGNRTPIISIPNQTVNEGQTLALDLSKLSSDPDGERLTYSLESGVGEIKGRIYTYSPAYNEAGEKTVKIKVSDGISGVETTFKIYVSNVNKPPVFSIPDIFIQEGKTVSIELKDYTKDPDGDSITFAFENGVGKVESGIFIYTPSYEEAGQQHCQILISDGSVTVGGVIVLYVSNVNRSPAMALSDITIKAGETLTLDLLNYSKDSDGDMIVYTVENGVGVVNGSIYSFAATEKDIGERLVVIRANDGTDYVDASFRLTVEK